LGAAVVFGVGWMLAQALLWSAIGEAIDTGINSHHPSRLLFWVLIVLALGLLQAVCGTLRHQLSVENWMFATYRSVQLVGRHVSLAGLAVTDDIPAGDVVNTVAADVMRVGGAFDVIARFIGAIVAWIAVSFILLSTSVTLGLIVLLGVPFLALFTAPLMKPLHASQAAQREAAGRLAALGADTVAGLRILRGIGGESVFFDSYKAQSQRVRFAGNRIAAPQAGLESGQILLPALLVAVVTYIGARDIVAGTLQPGQLVAFFGYTSFLTTPLRTAIEWVISSTRAMVGARKVLAILAIDPLVHETSKPRAWPAQIDIYADEISGLHFERGSFVALVTETTSEATALTDRLGRFINDVHGVTLDGVALDEFSLSDTRQHILVSEIEPRLFSGVLRDELTPHANPSPELISEALEAASALDVLDALDGGLDSIVEERGRSFSGGQRQRLALVRALLSKADLLILVEPTSAVDAHTEGRIAERLRRFRAGKTTIVATTSPLLLEHVDTVVVLQNGNVTLTGTHEELFREHSGYRNLILRGGDV
jgi:ABC-type multidrug transport system fused ATPase/permease subunit